MKTNHYLIAVIILLISSAFWLNQSPADADSVGWTPVYKHNKNGQPIGGSKADLLAAIRRGYDIRIGWGFQHPRDADKTIEHVVKPNFLGISKGELVYAILDEHPALKAYFNVKNPQFDNPNITWSCVMNTEGNFNAIWYNRAAGKKVRDFPQRHVMTWFVNYPAKRSNKKLWKLFEVGGM
ncbi:MAG TPA: hypothetical protein DCS93_26665 [Microscillaceae bacterium]|nr:hypothetical protein [Microscillaceae bacterium]